MKWKTAKIGDVCQIVSGTTPSTNVAEYWGGKFNWIAPAEIAEDSKYIFNTQKTITQKAIDEVSMRLLPVGTVLLSSRAPIGKVAIVATEMYCNQGFKNLICSEALHNEFLFWFLKGKKDFLNSLGRGATFKEISKNIVASIEIPLPPLAEQCRIAAILDKVDAIRRKRQQAITLADEFLKSVFLDMFGDPVTNPKGWDILSFTEFASSRLGKMLDGKRQTGKLLYPYLANYNVQWFKCDTSILRKMDFNESDRAEFALKKGDLLVCEGGEAGRTAVWNGEIHECFFQKAIHRVRCDSSKSTPEYLQYVFFFYAKNNLFNDIIGGSSTIPHLTGIKLRKLCFPIPSIKSQKLFSHITQQVETSKNCLLQQASEADHAFKALQQSFFG